MKEKEQIGVVNDQLGCPTYAIDLARALVTIACHAQPRAGIYHYSNSGPISWYDFASAIGSLTQSACKVEPIPTSAYPTPARRPAWSVLDNTRIQQVFGIPQLPWKDRLQACLQALGY
jgi:dTDP-4-dehydrorhamnose reductase